MGGEETNPDLGIEHRTKVEMRIRQLEGGVVTKISGTAKQSAKFDKHETKSEVIEYKAAADVTMGTKRSATDSDDDEKPAVKKVKVEEVEAATPGEKKKKKKKDKNITKADDSVVEESVVETVEIASVEPPKKKKKKSKGTEQEVPALDDTADTTME